MFLATNPSVIPTPYVITLGSDQKVNLGELENYFNSDLPKSFIFQDLNYDGDGIQNSVCVDYVTFEITTEGAGLAG